jgi:hypothetical protein
MKNEEGTGEKIWSINEIDKLYACVKIPQQNFFLYLTSTK